MPPLPLHSLPASLVAASRTMGAGTSTDMSSLPGCHCTPMGIAQPKKGPPAIMEVPCCFGTPLRVSQPKHMLAPHRSTILANRGQRQAWSTAWESGPGLAAAFVARPVQAPYGTSPSEAAAAGSRSALPSRSGFAPQVQGGLFIIREESRTREDSSGDVMVGDSKFSRGAAGRGLQGANSVFQAEFLEEQPPGDQDPPGARADEEDMQLNGCRAGHRQQEILWPQGGGDERECALLFHPGAEAHSDSQGHDEPVQAVPGGQERSTEISEGGADEPVASTRVLGLDAHNCSPSGAEARFTQAGKLHLTHTHCGAPALLVEDGISTSVKPVGLCVEDQVIAELAQLAKEGDEAMAQLALLSVEEATMDATMATTKSLL